MQDFVDCIRQNVKKKFTSQQTTLFWSSNWKRLDNKSCSKGACKLLIASKQQTNFTLQQIKAFLFPKNHSPKTQTQTNHQMSEQTQTNNSKSITKPKKMTAKSLSNYTRLPRQNKPATKLLYPHLWRKRSTLLLQSKMNWMSIKYLGCWSMENQLHLKVVWFLSSKFFHCLLMLTFFQLLWWWLLIVFAPALELPHKQES